MSNIPGLLTLPPKKCQSCNKTFPLLDLHYSVPSGTWNCSKCTKNNQREQRRLTKENNQKNYSQLSEFFTRTGKLTRG